uniref:glucose-6-phosphate 1-epimerase n=1 Tax=Strigamia maritima TaxID=126957 RepID=T1J3U6_STRMM
MSSGGNVVVLDRGNNTTLTVHIHGATIVSWRVNNQEQLFVSKQAVFDCKKPIRGGIPVVFREISLAQFGHWNVGPQHGFARISRWNVEKPPTRLETGDVEVIFSLVDNEATRSVWNHGFKLTYRLLLREKELHLNVGVINTGANDFLFHVLLHTYLKVPDVSKCLIMGLHGCMYVDKARDGAVYQETREAVNIEEFTDRIYQNTPDEHIMNNVVGGRKMRIHKYNFPDTVIWNPWVERAREIADFGDDEYPNMVCVEAGRVSTPVHLPPGALFEASEVLQVM